MDDPGTAGSDGSVEHGRGARHVLPLHALRVGPVVGERGSRVDRLVAPLRGLAHRVGVGHVPDGHLDALVVGIDPERGEMLVELGGSAHERPDPLVVLEQPPEDVDAQEPGRPGQQDSHGPSLVRSGDATRADRPATA